MLKQTWSKCKTRDIALFILTLNGFEAITYYFGLTLINTNETHLIFPWLDVSSEVEVKKEAKNGKTINDKNPLHP